MSYDTTEKSVIEASSQHRAQLPSKDRTAIQVVVVEQKAIE